MLQVSRGRCWILAALAVCRLQVGNPGRRSRAISAAPKVQGDDAWQQIAVHWLCTKGRATLAPAVGVQIQSLFTTSSQRCSIREEIYTSRQRQRALRAPLG